MLLSRHTVSRIQDHKSDTTTVQQDDALSRFHAEVRASLAGRAGHIA
jgi:hypothetical protein